MQMIFDELAMTAQVASIKTAAHLQTAKCARMAMLALMMAARAVLGAKQANLLMIIVNIAMHVLCLQPA